jgi:ribonuclease BN (tRNA processing enzyme)
MSKIKIIFLGTNGWYSTPTGNTVCTLILSEKFNIVLDAGDGIYKLDRYINDQKPILIFLSHVHLDHIIGLHILGKFRFKQNITIYGYKRIKSILNEIIEHPFSAPLNNLPLKIKILDIDEGYHKFELPFTCKLLMHSDPTLGYKFEIDNKIITYCTDTGICDNLYYLSENADLFITECSYKPGQEEWGWPHLKIEEAALIAKQSKVKRLILTHFDASYYISVNDRKNAENIARTIFTETLAAQDDLELLI